MRNNKEIWISSWKKIGNEQWGPHTDTQVETQEKEKRNKESVIFSTRTWYPPSPYFLNVVKYKGERERMELLGKRENGERMMMTFFVLVKRYREKGGKKMNGWMK